MEIKKIIDPFSIFISFKILKSKTLAIKKEAIMDGYNNNEMEVTNHQLPITNKIFEVQMFHFCYSTGFPLLTVGAGPCMVVIVHDAENRRGCLAHLPPGYKDPWKYTFSLVEEMMKKIPNNQNLELVFLAGTGYERQQNPNQSEERNENLKDYIRRQFGKKNQQFKSIRDFTHTAAKPDKANVLYVPELSKVVLVLDQTHISKYRSNGEQDLINPNDNVNFHYLIKE